MKISTLFLLLFFINLHGQSNSEKTVSKLMDVMNIEQHIKVTRENCVMWVVPSQEVEYLKSFDATVPVFKNNFRQYYLSNYTQEEMNELLKFYESPLGRKITGNSGTLLELSVKAEEIWDDASLEVIYSYIYK